MLTVMNVEGRLMAGLDRFFSTECSNLALSCSNLLATRIRIFLREHGEQGKECWVKKRHGDRLTFHKLARYTSFSPIFFTICT